jgi:putative component of toxin-antitoxin plasmid stabilization module
MDQVTASISSSSGTAVVILLAGGDKRTQERDIAVARELASNL